MGESSRIELFSKRLGTSAGAIEAGGCGRDEFLSGPAQEMIPEKTRIMKAIISEEDKLYTAIRERYL